MAYGPPPQPGPGQQPGWQQQPWQQQGNAWQQQPQGGWQQQPQQGRGAQQPGHFGPVSDEEKTWALMAYVGQFLVAVIAPAVVYLGRARSPFVRRHAAQGLNMGIASLVVWVAGLLLQLLFAPLVWAPLVFTAAIMVFLVYAARAANRGEFRKVPAVLAWPLIK
ncbi:hypothetical protein GCM10009678_27630 [Actinomadura kijaniata]|uniref:Putative Tic20 family protein n=1 Tax=Actinomadura namibiensis TaxID=182080 RepID=A0A7W3LKA5_ACTNM|nr:DUF4870 domain-containing protein [Actinomadura namibiensis]MBA8949696.1 putative Tic20 family protein [Actinomadura namibiensis]